jgi:hypothetical protein
MTSEWALDRTIFPLSCAIKCTLATISAELEQDPFPYNIDYIEESSVLRKGAELAIKMLLPSHIHFKED